MAGARDNWQELAGTVLKTASQKVSVSMTMPHFLRGMSFSQKVFFRA